MNLNLILWFLSLVAVIWLYRRLAKVSKSFGEAEQDYSKLQHKYEALQRTLATRGRRLDVLLSTISEVVLRVDHLGRVLGGNEQAEALFQFDKSPALPQSILLFYRDSEWMRAYQQALQALPEQRVLPEMLIQGRVLLPRLAGLGENEALLLCMDVTAYMQLQKKQKSLLENLMHDLKTPLTSLLGYARSIEAFADDVELRQEAVSVIAKEAKHINDLMNSMLTLNQIEHQQSGVDKSCDVIAVIKQTWESLDYERKQKDVSLDMGEMPKSLQVKMTEVDCHRILMNVANNALKFSPKASNIKCSFEEEEGSINVVIQDEGHGIPNTHLPRVTERFYRVDSVRGREKKEGHGLGLAIVKETLERDGGKLHLRNRETGGLSVKLEIPT